MSCLSVYPFTCPLIYYPPTHVETWILVCVGLCQVAACGFLSPPGAQLRLSGAWWPWLSAGPVTALI